MYADDTNISFQSSNLTDLEDNMNKTPAKAFTPPAKKKKGHKVVFRQKSKRVTGLYLKAPANPHSFAMESVKICHFKHSR